MGISLHTAADFVDFVKRHGLMSPKEGDKPVVFRIEKSITLPYHHPKHTGSDDDENPVSVNYQAPVRLFEETQTVHFDATPDAPRYWGHVMKQHVWRKLDSKKDAVEALLEFNVDKDKLKAFDKVKVAQLEEITDTSPSDTDNIEEILRKTTKTPPDTLVFKVKDMLISEIIVKISKERHGSKLEYALTADYSRIWKERSDSIEKAIADAGFRVYRGSVER